MLVGAAVLGGIATSLHNISYANLDRVIVKAAEFADLSSKTAWAAQDSTKPAGVVHADGAADAKLKAALQKRLLVPNPADLTLGSPSPGPFAGITRRTVTINTAEQGQKIEVELFLDPAGDKGILAQRFALFDASRPWEQVDLKTMHLEDRPTRGPAGAPVQIIEFADFECPFCARAFNEVETLVNTTYKGRVHLIWKNFPLPAHAWAEQAAIAAECAREQNPEAFWTMAGDFYRDQTAIEPQNLRDHIYSYANALKLDSKVLNACILGSSSDARVAQDKKDAQAIPVNSTPTFIINGIPVIGLPSSNVFDFVITSQLQEHQAAR